MPHINAFGCFDDCFNFMGGYFLLSGKRIYADFFYNHMPFMAFLSFLIQKFSHPESIYELVLRHRQTVFYIGLIANILLLFRFGWKALLFTVLYELSKFYIFGDRFLAEGIVVYLLIYLWGIVWEKYNGKTLFWWDYVLGALFAWLTIWFREPYIPLAIVLYGLLVVPYFPSLLTGEGKQIVRNDRKWFLCSLFLFLLLNILTLSLFSFKDFFFNVYTINSQTVAKDSLSQSGGPVLTFLKAFFYPILIFFWGPLTLFKKILIGLDVLLLSLSGLTFVKTKRFLPLFLLFLILALANIRVDTPGKVYYEAFHEIPWYGLFIFSVAVLLPSVVSKWKKVLFVVYAAYLLLVGYFIVSKDSYIHEKTDPQVEFVTQYGNLLQTGEVVKVLSTPTTTFFTDGFDELIMWDAKRPTPYKYQWYTSSMPQFSVYSDARITMFKSNPPDMYYGSCPKDNTPQRQLPDFIKNDYVRLTNWGKPSCLWVYKPYLPKIKDEQWGEAKKWLYELPYLSF